MSFREAIEAAGKAADVAGVVVIIAGVVLLIVIYSARIVRRHPPAEDAYISLRHGLGRVILLGLELLVAADIVRTVAVTPTFRTVGVLAAIVAIRTFLSLSIEMEISGRFPWQRRGEAVASDPSRSVADGASRQS